MILGASRGRYGRLAIATGLVWTSAVWSDNNLHLVDSDATTGYAVYRMGRPDRQDLARICGLGVQEIAVLSGNAASCERRAPEGCSTLRVVYDERQDVGEPLSAAFLRRFDAWVVQAMGLGKKIAFRCNCGCHRTGRLAAYYQMRYQGLSVAEANASLHEHGKRMWWPRYRVLPEQVQALHDYIQGRACSVAREHCVREASVDGEAGWMLDDFQGELRR